jgi:methionyl-tRNA synthetase
VTGSDAHGTPIVISAEQVGSKPEEVALKYHQQYKKLLKLWNIEIDNYSITHNPTHTEFCRVLWRNPKEWLHLQIKKQTTVLPKMRDFPARQVC